MRNTWLIIRREYLERVRTRSFLVLTLLLPAIVGASFMLPMKIATMKSGKRVPHLVIVSAEPRLGELVRSQLLAKDQSEDEDGAKDSADSGDQKYLVDVDTAATEAERSALRAKMAAGTIDGYIWLDADAVAQRKALYSGHNATDYWERGELSRALTRAFAEQQLTVRGVTPEQTEEIFKPVKLEMVRMENGQENKSSGGMFGLIFGMVMLLYMAVLFYGISVMRSILEEKNTRIMEVLLSSATPTQLMAGKLVGVGAVGLTQMAIWMVMGGTLALPALAAYPNLSDIHISSFTLVAFVSFFLLGYLLYSTIYAGVGAISTTEQEGQQLQLIVVLPLVVGVFMLAPVIRAPDSPVAFWTSLVPFFSPLLMFARIAVQPPPAWQIALSLALLVGTIAGLVIICARIYRVGVLMYGKRPTLPEILKWLKYERS